MLFAADPSAEITWMNVAIQGGSFAVLVGILLYVGKVLVPKAIDLHEKQAAKFDSEIDKVVTANERSIEKVVAAHERQLERRDVAFEKLTGIVDRLADRVQALEHKTSEHRALGEE